MKWIKLFEDFKKNNLEGTLITDEDIIQCIKQNGYVYATIIKDFPNNDPEEPLIPVSIDEKGLVTIEYDGKEYEIDLKNINKIEY